MPGKGGPEEAEERRKASVRARVEHHRMTIESNWLEGLRRSDLCNQNQTEHGERTGKVKFKCNRPEIFTGEDDAAPTLEHESFMPFAP